MSPTLRAIIYKEPPEVNLNKSVAQIPPQNVNKVAHSDFDTQRRRQMEPKTGHQ